MRGTVAVSFAGLSNNLRLFSGTRIGAGVSFAGPAGAGDAAAVVSVAFSGVGGADVIAFAVSAGAGGAATTTSSTTSSATSSATSFPLRAGSPKETRFGFTSSAERQGGLSGDDGDGDDEEDDDVETDNRLAKL